MLNCKEITELVSTHLDSQIPWYRKMELSAHLMLCRRCRRYFEQLKLLQKMFTQAGEQAKTAVLSDEARLRIKEKLEKMQITHLESLATNLRQDKT
jgi:predicted anti-sigma-YlaC factor YlaD